LRRGLILQTFSRVCERFLFRGSKGGLSRQLGVQLDAAVKRASRCLVSISVASLIAAANLTSALASTAPPLGTTTSYAILAGTTVTNTGNSVISGDLGVSPGTAVTGFPPGTLNGTQRTGANPAVITAKTDLTTAYNAAASSPCNFNQTGANLGGQTLIPGTYCQTTAPTLTGTLTLSGNGVYIFQIGSTLITAPGATVALTNGAQACNVFWQVGSSATLDTTTTFVGTIMALTSISLNNGASIAGRALAQNGAVTLINNTITVPGSCTAPVPTPTPAPVAVPTPTPAVAGAPAAGGGPPQGEGFPWMLALVAGVLASAGAAALGLRVRAQGRNA
jgi:ice-binding like protein